MLIKQDLRNVLLFLSFLLYTYFWYLINVLLSRFIMGKKAKSQTRQILIRKGNENDGNSSIMSTLQPNQQPIHRKIERECMKEQLYEYST